ncbi:restriction endonuclease subunit S [Desulfovibrio cuneatus]|uniref:restriction endonuclease subunit S n=1 Tax=Desulfovibrio cuneatus TaxID=159728 RepID=UPI00040A9324|nr:restriction endonuclease subunit S [Desulfovibrio cuneatus]
MAGRPKSGHANRAQFKAAQLRQSILQAAVQGKLVPQNLHDEPASVLLERIKAEKAQLVKEGKIKKEKPLPLIMEDEIPYDLPEGWVWCRLRDISSAITDGDHQPPPKQENGIPFLVISNISSGYLDFSNTRFVSESYFKALSSDKVAKSGDILFTVTGSYGIPILVSGKQQFCFQRHIALFRALPNIDINYSFISLRSSLIYNQCSRIATGTAQKTVPLVGLRSLLIPLPPLAEQQRIVAKVNELMTMCDELEAAEKKLDALEANFAEYLPKSILQAAVQGKLVPQNIHDEPASALLEHIRAEKAQLVKEGKVKKEEPLPSITEEEMPYDLPEGWEWCRLGELCNYGAANNASPSHISQDSWLLELEDLERDSGRLLQRVTFSSRASKSTKHVFTKGNILYSKLRPYLNKVIIAPEDGYCTSEILPLDFGIINHDYMLWFLRNPIFVEYTNTCSYGVKMPRLGTEDGRRALVPLPPLAEQQRIASKTDELMALCKQLHTAPDLPEIQPIKLAPASLQQIPYEEPELLMAARGQVGQQDSEELKQAQEDLFGE